MILCPFGGFFLPSVHCASVPGFRPYGFLAGPVWFHGLVKVSFMAWGQIKEHATPGGAGLHMLVSVVFTFMVFWLREIYLKPY